MKVILALLLLCALHARAGEPVILFARLLEALPIQLIDGSKWQMEKGDCFPVIAYKEAHTKLFLQLAGTAFVVPATKAEIVEEKNFQTARASYRVTLANYLDAYASDWRKQAEAGKRR
jgi:hypothetical protein